MDASSAIKYKTVGEYLKALPASTRSLMQQVRSAIKKEAPGAEEVISYNMPAFKLQGMLVWYAAFKNHIGFYPKATGIEKFKKELSVYKGAKGSVQFPIDQPLPLDLIGKIVKYRVQENMKKSERPGVRKSGR